MSRICLTVRQTINHSGSTDRSCAVPFTLFTPYDPSCNSTGTVFEDTLSEVTKIQQSERLIETIVERGNACFLSDKTEKKMYELKI